MSSSSPTLLDKLAARSRLSWTWFVVLIAIILVFTPFVLAHLEGILGRLIEEGLWRPLLMAPAIILYILALARPLDNNHANAIEALREVAMLDNEAFDRLIEEGSKVDARAEGFAFSLGAAFGILTNFPWSNPSEFSGLVLYIMLTSGLMWGLLSWISFNSIAGTRLQSTLFDQPLKIDLFNLKPFEPIGRNSLFVSLAFIGGSAISLLFINPLSGGLDPLSLVLYGILGLIAVLLFFLNMRHTHNALARLKKEEIRTVERAIGNVFHTLKGVKAEGGDLLPLSTELNMWLKYEERLRKSRTWPYNTAMLRTLLLSTLVPALASLGQRVVTSLLLK